MSQQDDITLKLYKALRNLSSSVRMAGLDLGIKVEMIDSLEALECAQVFVTALEKGLNNPLPKTKSTGL